jgi:hypothetical protein
MTKVFNNPVIRNSYKSTLKKEVLLAYKNSLPGNSFWNFFSVKYLAPAFCLLVFASLIGVRYNNYLVEKNIDIELSQLTAELESDIDLLNAISFSEL